MSYDGPGSIYSIGLHNIGVMCFLLSIASAISVAAFWGRIQGKLGSLGDSLSATLFKVRTFRWVLGDTSAVGVACLEVDLVGRTLVALYGVALGLAGGVREGERGTYVC